MKTNLRYIIITVVFAAFCSCQSETEDPGVDCTASTLSINLTSVTDATCGLQNGTLIVTASGGSGSYSYRLNTGQTSANGTFENLPAAVYTVLVDDGDCEADLTASVNNTDGVLIDDVKFTDSGCGSTNGTITVAASEGAPPYRYALDQGDFQDENLFSSLAQGEYTVRVTDSQDCEITQEVMVPSGISWDAEVSAIISMNCAIPTCHGGTQPPDYRDFDNVVANAENIKTRTGNGTMPPTGPLSDSDVQKIACWVDDGALDN